MGKNFLNILKEKESLNTNYIGKTRLLDNIKIFGFIPIYSNVSLHIKMVCNDKNRSRLQWWKYRATSLQ